MNFTYLTDRDGAGVDFVLNHSMLFLFYVLLPFVFLWWNGNHMLLHCALCAFTFLCNAISVSSPIIVQYFIAFVIYWKLHTTFEKFKGDIQKRRSWSGVSRKVNRTVFLLPQFHVLFECSPTRSFYFNASNNVVLTGTVKMIGKLYFSRNFSNFKSKFKLVLL